MCNYVMRSLALFALAATPPAFAQGGYPVRPVTVVVGFAPGGGTDTVARIIAKNLGDGLGQQVIVDNKAGAGGNIATDHVAKAMPDGHTILLGNVGALTVAPHIVARLPYDPLQDLAPISMAVVFPNVLVVHASVPARTLVEFIRLARDKPATLTYSTSGIGGAGHLAGGLLRMRAQIDIVHVPYKGGGPAVQGLLGGQVAAGVLTPVTALPHIKAGKVRALVTTGAGRDPYMPDVPTVAESGFSGYEATNWYAYMAPAKTPKEVVERLNREIVKALAAQEVKELLAKQGLEPKPSTPDELARYIEREYATWGRVVKEAKITAN
jgi:tripartite-type tricarboxylate transporter receptor subunit TctC